MKHGDFKLGGEFRSDDRLYRVTDIGARTVIAIRIDQVEVESMDGGRIAKRTLSGADARGQGWFDGPPYAVAEHVFDEGDIEACIAEDEWIGSALRSAP